MATYIFKINIGQIMNLVWFLHQTLKHKNQRKTALLLVVDNFFACITSDMYE